jgi:surface antigen
LLIYKTGGKTMKKLILIGIISIASAITAQAADHRHNDIRGVIVGAGGGALLGQAIGRNTQSTVVGTAIGGVVGYLVGSEMDRKSGYSNKVIYHREQPIRNEYRREQPVRYQYYEPIVQYNHPQSWKRPAQRRNCRESEILGTINGKARKMYGTVCKTDGVWQLVSEGIGYNDDYRRKGKWHKTKGRKNKHYKDSRNSRWVRHRF